MGTIADMGSKELKFTKKATLNLLLKELSPRIFRTIGGVYYVIGLESEEGFFEITIYDTTVEHLNPLYKEKRKQHVFIERRIEFEPFVLEDMSTDSYIQFVNFILSELDNSLIGH